MGACGTRVLAPRVGQPARLRLGLESCNLPISCEGYFLASASKDGKPMLRHGENGDWYGTFEGHKVRQLRGWGFGRYLGPGSGIWQCAWVFVCARFDVVQGLTFTPHVDGLQGAVWACVLDTPALKCATGSGDFSARLWDACGGNQLHEFQHNHIVRTVNFSFQNSNKLATGGVCRCRMRTGRGLSFCGRPGAVVIGRFAAAASRVGQNFSCNYSREAISAL